MEEYKNFAQKIGLVGITHIVVALSSLILLPIITKNLSISEYGVWVQITVTIGLIPTIATLGLPYSMNRFLSHSIDKKEILEGFYSIIFVIIFVSILISLIFYIFSNNIAYYLLDGYENLAILLSLIIFVSCLFNPVLNYFRAVQSIRVYSLFLLLQTLLNLGLVIISIYLGYGLFGAIIGVLLSYIILVLISFLVIYNEIGFSFPHFQNIKEYLKFGLPTIPSNLSYWIVESSDRYIIGLLLGPALVGYYSPGYALGSILSFFLVPFSTLLLPTLSEKYDKGETVKVEHFLNYSLKFYLLITIPSVFGISILAKPLLFILTTPEIAASSYYITPFIAISSLIYGIYGIIAHPLILAKKTKILGIFWILASILNIIINITLIPVIGIIAAAISTLIVYGVVLLLSIFYTRENFKLKLDIRWLLKIILTSLLMSLIISFIAPYGIFELILVIVLSSSFYFLILFFFGVIDKKEMKFLKILFKN